MTSGPAQDEVRRLLGRIEEIDPLIRRGEITHCMVLAAFLFERLKT